MKSVLTLATVIAIATASAGCSRLTGLPDVSATVTVEESGLSDLDRWAKEAKQIDVPMDAAEIQRASANPPSDPLDLVRLGNSRIAAGAPEDGLRDLIAALEVASSDLVVGNAFRRAVYDLDRKFLAEARDRGERTPKLPDYLRGEPLATLERIAAAKPGREIRLQVALAYVDRMVLNPALEIKAPASIDSTRTLTAILTLEPNFVPALVGRGLNHLYRPAKLVWPEHPAPPPDAASRDFSYAAAIGLKVGGAPARVKGLILLMLGDAYAHEGKIGLARSWWSLARQTTNDPAVADPVARRATWGDDEVLDRLEEGLDDRMADMDHPVGDLSFLWKEGTRGPS